MQILQIYPNKSARSRLEQRFSAGPNGASLMDEASIRACTIICSGTTTRTADGLPSRTRSGWQAA